ncbi:MAG: hypothetical protein QNJ40_02490 [Xanthomonadales bacterium]|nr:hypothetical protein [Xanthomonadales bacterium]
MTLRALFFLVLVMPAQSWCGDLQSFRVPGSAFVPLNSATQYEDAGAGCRYRVSGPETFALDVQLPEGAMVSALRVFFEDRSTLDLNVSLQIGDGQGIALSLAEVSSSGIGGFGAEQAMLTPPLEIDRDLFVLLHASLPGTDEQLKLCGAEVQYMPPTDPPAVGHRMIPAAAFTAERNFTSWTDGDAGCSRFTSVVPPLAAVSAGVPPGSHIETLKLFYFDQNSSALGEILLRLLEQDPQGPFINTLASVTSDQDTGFGTAMVTVDREAGDLPLYLDWSQAIRSSDLRLCGAQLIFSPAAGARFDDRIAAAAFVPASSRARFSFVSGCINHRGAGTPGRFIHPVHPPSGASIVSMTGAFFDNDIDNNLTLSLLALDGQGGETTLAEFVSADEGSGTVNIDLPEPYLTNEQVESYALVAELDDGESSTDLLFCSAGVEYLRPALVFEDGFEAVL